MLRQIVSPLGALFTLEFPDDIHAYLSDKEEKELADRIAYMRRIAGGASTEEAYSANSNTNNLSEN